MAGPTPGIRRRGDRFFVRHGDVSLGTTGSLRDAQVMRDLYTVASGSEHVPTWFRRGTYALQIAAVEDMDADQRRDLCVELVDAYKLGNGTTLRPVINGRQLAFATRAEAVAAMYKARGGFSNACKVLFQRFFQADE